MLGSRLAALASGDVLGEEDEDAWIGGRLTGKYDFQSRKRILFDSLKANSCCRINDGEVLRRRGCTKNEKKKKDMEPRSSGDRFPSGQSRHLYFTSQQLDGPQRAR